VGKGKRYCGTRNGERWRLYFIPCYMHTAQHGYSQHGRARNGRAHRSRALDREITVRERSITI
jgi:hypothetical protein